MKIKKVKVHNLYSYNDAEFELDDYNVIVGPNGSGKTNIVRILKLIMEPTNRLLEPYQRYQDGESSSLELKLELTKDEINALLQFLVLTNEQPISEEKEVEVGFYWNDKYGSSDYEIVVRLYNGITIFKNYITYTNSLQNMHKNKLPSSEIPLGKYTSLICLSFEKEKETETRELLNNKFESLTNLCKDDCKDIFDANLILKDYPDLINNLFLVDNKYLIIRNELINTVRDIRKGDEREMFRGFIRDVLNIDYWEVSSLSNYQYYLITLLKQRLQTVDINRFNINMLAFNLFTIKDKLEDKYFTLQQKFKDFLGLEFKVSSSIDNKAQEYNLYNIIIREYNKEIRLEDSASGYFEILYIFSNILGNKDSIIILDEPALNLHPIKIKQLAEKLKELVKESNNQVIVITHSPYFVTHELLNDESTNLLYVKRDDNGSKVYHKPKGFKSDIEPHLFNPNIFFSNCVILVEGSSDIAVLSAINNSLEDILGKHDISIINFSGKNNLDKYIELCEKYNISYIVILDDDYLFRWNKINEDKEKLLRELHDDKMKQKLKKESIKLDGFSIDDKDNIEIDLGNENTIVIKDKVKKKEIKFQLLNNNTTAKLIIDNKELKLAVEKVGNDYYVYKENDKKLCCKRDDNNVIILEGEIEDELRRLWIDNIGLEEHWDKNSNKVKELEAYEFIDILMKDDKGKEKIKNSKFNLVIEKALRKVGVNPDKELDKYFK
ncbi:MAG: hypothetical protein KatS3mg003_0436 [Candidatus Nitrosocaldaceae archaeon]|nr:MAG: hypothetical protein KatS3mg003_0436 [Candidatus Nitrosocaldaceae archaeon]